MYLWDPRTRARVASFGGITGAVQAVAVSADDAFLAAAGTDGMLCIWDVATREPLFTKVVAPPTGGEVPPIAVLLWGATDRTGRRPKYTLVFNAGDRVAVATLEYDFGVMKYTVAVAASAVPSSGFARRYTCGALDTTGARLVCGTSAGELVTYALAPAPMFKGSVQASSHGVQALLLPPLPGPDGAPTAPMLAYAGGGDGAVRIFAGAEASWSYVADGAVLGRVASLSPAASGAWLLVGTDAGHVYRLSWGAPLAAPPRGGVRAAADLLETAHTSAATAVAFWGGVTNGVATAGGDGTLRLWSLDTYGARWVHYAPPGATPSALWADRPGAGVALVSGSGAPGIDRPAAGVAYRAATGGVAPPGAAAAAASAAAAAAAAVAAEAAAASGGVLPVQLYAGFSDGTLRAYDVYAASDAAGSGSREAWRVTAHRGGVTALSGNPAVVVSGGGDGRVCVWSRKAHDLLLQFSDHGRPVLSVLADAASLELVYSVGADRLLNTYNLRTEKRMKVHAMPRADAATAAFTCGTQNGDPASEHEVFTGTSDGRVYVWDVDIPDIPIGVIDLAALLPPAVLPPAPPAAPLPGSGTAGSVAAARSRAAAAGTGTAYVTAGVASSAAAASSPAAARPDLRVTSVAVAPRSRVLAVATATGLVAVLALGTSGTVAAPGAAAGVAAALTAGRTLPPGATSLSSIAAVRLLAVTQGFSPYTAIAWSPDERQLIATAADAPVAVYNWYGSS